MYSAEWILALKLQIVIAIGCFILAISLFRIPKRTAAVAVLIFNSIPITTPPGFATPLFLHDFFVPIMLLLLQCRYKKGRLFQLALLAILVWPLMGVIVGKFIEPSGNDWITFIYRRLGFITFFSFAAIGIFPDIDLEDFMDTCNIVWSCMAIVGILQYYGVWNVDFDTLTSEFQDKTILESVAAQRGFMGLNRGAIGLWGTVFSTYCFAQLTFRNNIGVFRNILYIISMLLTCIVILFAGSRTGLAAILVSWGYVLCQSLRFSRKANFHRLFPFVIIIFGLFMYIVAPVFEVIGGRYIYALSNVSVDDRAEVQLEAIEYIFSNARPMIIGMGYSEGEFTSIIKTGLSHPHSEYIEVLWVSGIIGLMTYLGFLFYLYRAMEFNRNVDSGCIAIRGMIIAGLVMGFGVGHIMITTTRLASFGMLILFIYGLAVKRSYLQCKFA
ncbi:MAG: O-antigen ligase family protein [bacterium]|jgi:hypothetical protein